MPDIEYQKIELHSTHNLAKDNEKIQYEKETVQRLMIENQIQFAIEIEEKDVRDKNNRYSNSLYVLNLVVRKDDVEKVIELLDREGGFGYYVDLDETFDLMKDAESEEQDGAFVEIPEELRGTEEVAVEDEPIKIYEQDNGNITIEFKPIGMTALANLIMKATLIFAFSMIYIMEIGLMIYSWNGYDYETVTGMFVAMIIETPIFIWFYKVLNKKKGE